MRGDTMTNPCKSESLKFKLDLHIVVLNDEEVVVDGMTAEVAETATKHKLYEDKLSQSWQVVLTIWRIFTFFLQKYR